jgi:tRNA-Thr(GGU) m(6)t(6)A37 methyltransferase TsaA
MKSGACGKQDGHNYKQGKIMNEIKYNPIGVIRSPFKEPKGTPIQPAAAKGIDGTVELFPEYVEGLKDVEGFSHIILIYHFHLSTKRTSLKLKPYMDKETRGVFAMRGPSRPNPIGISTVRLLGIEKNILHIQNVDIVDGTPLLDIKPYVPKFDTRKVERTGWLARNAHKLPTSKDDGRFTNRLMEEEDRIDE